MRNGLASFGFALAKHIDVVHIRATGRRSLVLRVPDLPRATGPIMQAPAGPLTHLDNVTEMLEAGDSFNNSRSREQIRSEVLRRRRGDRMFLAHLLIFRAQEPQGRQDIRAVFRLEQGTTRFRFRGLLLSRLGFDLSSHRYPAESFLCSNRCFASCPRAAATGSLVSRHRPSPATTESRLGSGDESDPSSCRSDSGAS